MMNLDTIASHFRSPRLKRLSREGMWIVAGHIAAVLGSLVLVRALTERLKPSNYGQLALGLTLANLVYHLIMGGITCGIGRFYSIAAEKNDLRGYLRSSGRLLLYAVTAVFIIACFLLFSLHFLGHSRWMSLAAAALMLSVLSGYNLALNGIQNAARQRSVVAFHGGLDAWLKIGLAVAIMFWFGASSESVIAAYAISSLIVTASQLFSLKRLMRSQIRPGTSGANWLPQIWRYSWPFSAWGIFTWAQQVSDRWALQIFTSTEDVGLYAVVLQLGYVPMGIASLMVMNFLGPILYQRSGNATDQARNVEVHTTAWRITFATLGLTILAFIATLLLNKWIFRLLVAEEYRSASYLLPWTILAGGLFATGQMLALKLMSEMKSAAMTAAKITTALLGVGFNVYAASHFGVNGVVASLVAFGVIYLCWMAWLARDTPADSAGPRQNV